MSQVVEVDLRQIVVSNSTFGPNEIQQIVGSISADYNNFRSLRDAVAELEQQVERTPAASARLGVCQYLLGRYSDAVRTLTNADGGALTHFYLGKAHLALDQYHEALAAYESAERAGYNHDDVALALADAKRFSGDAAGALALLMHYRARLSRRPIISINGPQPSLLWAETAAKSSHCWNALSRPMAAMPAPCLVWRLKTIDMATTNMPAALRTGRSPISRACRHTGKSWLALRRHGAL